MAVLLLAVSAPSAAGRNPPEPGFPTGIRLPTKANGERAIAALGERLPEVSAHYAVSPERLRRHLRADPSLWVETNGELVYACGLGCADCGKEEAPAESPPVASIGPTDPGPFDTSEAFLLHSRPGANRVIYLDFDGHVDDTPGNWKDGASAPPYNIPNSNPANFSTEERNRIIEIWQRVAEDYSMYEIDVTTEEPDIEALRKTGSGDSAYGIRVVIGGSGNDWFGSNVGGVAIVGSFDAGNDVPCWVFPAGAGYTAKNIAEAASHEAGHTLGLLHDGIEGGASYYAGQGNWAPIMGNSYNKPISHWSKGEYTDANNTQDDLAVMLTQGAVYRPDDHGGSVGTATNVGADSSSATVNGVIERDTDIDFFRIEAAGGPLTLDATPAPSGANLRIEVKLYDAGGGLLETAAAADTTNGTQPVTLSRSVAAGIHYVSVDGIGNGSPLATGYSDYASLGQYTLSVTGVVPDGFTWLATTGGTKQWNAAGNWGAGSVPAGLAPNVRIRSNITGNQTIQLAGATAVGSLFLGDADGTHAFTLASAGGSLAFASPAELSKTSGGNDAVTAPVSLAGELVLTQSASGSLRFSGGIGGAGSLTKAGAGAVVFSSPNNYTGATVLEDGLLLLEDASGLPGGIDHAVGGGESALVFKGGVLGLHGDFTRQLGPGAGQLEWDPDNGGGSGGFAAFGADRQVRLNNGTGSFSWYSAILGAGNTLILGHPTATHTVNFRNGINFSGGKRTVQVEDGEAAVDAVLSGVLADYTTPPGSLNKTGPGVLSLTNANTYNGTTTVDGGVLRLQHASALPGGNLELTGGGVLGLGAGDLTGRTIGSGSDQVRWLGSGGFAAFGADRAVKFSDASIPWTTTNFIGAGRVLILGHDTADATLDWQQAISLWGNARIVQVDDGSAPIDAKMSGIITGGSADTNSTANILTKAGAGTLAFTAQNSHWGDTIVGAGTLMIGDGGTTGGVSRNSQHIIVETGAMLAANRSNTLNQGADALKVAISGEGGFAQVGTGNTVLTLANTYIGPTLIEAGTLTLGASDVLPDASEVLLGNATLNAGTFTDTLGTLDVAGAATLELGSGGALAFADSSTIDWTGGTLDIAGDFVSGSSLRFGDAGGGLTEAQLLRITLNGGGGPFLLDTNGYLVAVSGFESWQTTNGTTGGLDDDHDEDGVDNGIEYFIGGPNGNTTGLTPLPGVEENGGILSVTWTRAADYPGTYGTDFRVETSTTLAAPWTMAVAEPAPGFTVTFPSATEVKFTFPAGTRNFARLKVTGP